MTHQYQNTLKKKKKSYEFSFSIHRELCALDIVAPAADDQSNFFRLYTTRLYIVH